MIDVNEKCNPDQLFLKAVDGGAVFGEDGLK